MRAANSFMFKKGIFDDQDDPSALDFGRRNDEAIGHNATRLIWPSAKFYIALAQWLRKN
jgi:hypothetical protein